MKKVSLSATKPIGLVIALLSLAGATLLGVHVAHKNSAYPSSDSGELDAEVVHMASTVGGRLVDLHVHVNQAVKKGDLLYRIDPEPYQLAVHQAEANLALAAAEVENQERLVAVKTANAEIAQNQTQRAQTNRDLAARTVERLKPLAGKAYIPWQEYDQARVVLNNASVSLTESQKQASAAQLAIGDLKSSLAAQQAAQAALEQARYALKQTTISAPTDGYVTSLRVKEGEILAPSQVLFTLIANDSWFVSANMRETELAAVKPSACVTVYSMIDKHKALRGHVESIGWGVLSADSAGLGRTLPLVPRQMDWVHVAQRFPVRIKLDPAAPDLLRMGATATVEINHGAACP
ncbi:multidrug transporter subunit MdtN [Acetobacter sp.]|uniref:multidrug transporter subunit MdtN n=1 Tax=Acetobacter sp. TaxID=440 RepID=UPI0039ECAD48